MSHRRETRETKNAAGAGAMRKRERRDASADASAERAQAKVRQMSEQRKSSVSETSVK